MHGANATAGIFASYPSPYLSVMGGLIDQVNVTPVVRGGHLGGTGGIECTSQCVGEN